MCTCSSAIARPVAGRSGLLVLEAQVREGVAEPLAGRQEARGTVLLAFGVLGVIVGLPVDEPGRDDPPGQFLIPALEDPERLVSDSGRIGQTALLAPLPIGAGTDGGAHCADADGGGADIATCSCSCQSTSARSRVRVRLRVLIRAAWRRPEPARWSIGPHITGPMEHRAGWGGPLCCHASGLRWWRGQCCGTGRYRACPEGSAGPRACSAESPSDLVRSLLPRLPHGHHRLRSGSPARRHRCHTDAHPAAQ
jgi:hypothetical protein